MTSERIILLFLFFGGISAKKIDISKINATALRKPTFGGSATSFDYVWPPDFCDDWDDEEVFPHPDACWMYLICWEGELWELECPDDLYFDPVRLVCDDYEYVDCEGAWPPDGDPECPPPGSTEVRFLPAENCNEFYICLNGQPILLQCRPGQHWNMEREYCDDPRNAGCIDPDAPVVLPDCPARGITDIPHPNNCNWFIHCNHGSRTIHQCRHLHHFDIDYGQCRLQTVARCIKS